MSMQQFTDDEVVALQKQILLALCCPAVTDWDRGLLGHMRDKIAKSGAHFLISRKLHDKLNQIFNSNDVPHPDASNWASKVAEIFTSRLELPLQSSPRKG